MSNEKHKIDELFRQKLGNYELDAPDHVWRNIEAKRTPLHKAINYFKNKRAAVTVVTMLLVASLAYMSFVQVGNSTNTADENLQEATVSVPAATGTTTGKVIAGLPESVDAAETAGNNTLTLYSANENTPVANHNTPTGNNSDGNGSTGNGNTSNGVTSAANPGPTGGNNNQSDNNNNTVTTPEKNIETPVLETTPANNTPELVAENPVTVPAEIETDEQPSADVIDETKKQEKTTVKPDRLRKWSMDVYASGDIAGRSLSANGLSQQYINERNYSESFKPGFSVGARVNYDLNTNGMLKLRAGFQYSRINERVNFTSTTTTTRIETVTGVVVDPVTGQPIGTTTRTDTVQQTVTNTASAQNRLTFIDLPIQLEIGLFKNTHWNIFATGGAAVNLRFTQNGGMLNKDMNGIKELNSTANPYKTNAGISVLAGLGAEYRLCGNFSLLLETQYRQGLTSVFKPGEGMNQTFRAISVGAGLRYRF